VAILAVIVPVLMPGILLALSRYEDKVFSYRPARPRQTRRPRSWARRLRAARGVGRAPT
jgi:hypothetical protein